MTAPAWFGGAVLGAAWPGGAAPGLPALPPNGRRLMWTGRDAHGNPLSGWLPILVKPRIRPPSNFADGSNRAVELAAFLNSAPRTAIVDLTGMSIRIDQTVTITNPVSVRGGYLYTDDITGDGSDPNHPSTAARNRTHVRIKDTHDVILDGVEVRGANQLGGLADLAYISAYEAQHAFEIMGSSRVTLKGCTGSKMYGDGLYIGKTQFNTPDPTDIVVEDLHIHHTGRQGIAIAAGKRIRFVRPVLEEIRRTLIDTEPNDNFTVVEDVEFDHLKFGNHRLNWFSAASSYGVCRRIWVHDSTPTGPGLMQGGGQATFGNESLRNPNRQGPWTLERNIATAPYGTPSGWIWTFTNIDGVHAFDNSIAGQGSAMHLGKATGCTDVQQSGNQVPGGHPDIVEV